MTSPSPKPAAAVVSRRVLIVVDDAALAEMLGDVLGEAGHVAVLASDGDGVEAALAAGRFDAAIVDLDTRARNGVQLLVRLRELAPATTAIALLPCGGLPTGAAGLPYHLAIEKPARLSVVLGAVNVARAVVNN